LIGSVAATAGSKDAGRLFFPFLSLFRLRESRAGLPEAMAGIHEPLARLREALFCFRESRASLPEAFACIREGPNRIPGAPRGLPEAIATLFVGAPSHREAAGPPSRVYALDSAQTKNRDVRFRRKRTLDESVEKASIRSSGLGNQAVARASPCRGMHSLRTA